MTKHEAVTNLAFFLLERTGNVCGEWSGKLSAKEQRALFGAFLGKGQIVIDGVAETVKHIISVCFGMDYNITFESRWHLINETVTRAQLPEYKGNANIPRW